MHPAIENFLEKPIGYKIGAWVVSLLVVSFIFWTWVYKDKLTQLSELEEKQSKLTTEISHERRLAQNLSKFREEVKALDIKLKFALQELPDKKEIPDLLNSISNLAREAGLDVSLFRPMPEVFKDFYAEVPVSVSIEGTFHQIVTFFDEVGRLSRIVNINQIGFRDPIVSEDRVQVKADCVATTFRYLEESERISGTDTPESKKRRKR
jgi:type IV pilus assembly protein PilO